MHRIYFAAGLATFLSLLFYASYVFRIGERKDYSRLMTAVLLTLPLSPLVYFAVRLPLNNFVHRILDRDSAIYSIIIMVFVPVTEELVKLLPLILPFLHRRITSKNFVSFGMALGLGFAIGEIWLAALRTNRGFLDFPMPYGYILLGFVAERLMICLLHGTFTSFVLWRWKRGWGLGLAGAFVLHFLSNLPIHLANMNILGFSSRTWRFLVPLYLVFFFICMVLLLVFFRAGGEGLRQIFLRAKVECPECGKVYKRSYWLTHLSNKNYETCPHCGSRNPIDLKGRP